MKTERNRIVSAKESDCYVKTEDLAVGYHRKPLIRDVALTVRAGEVMTLIGPNGAGKSTILKSIAGQLEIMGGKVCLLGQDAMQMSGRQKARTLSMVMTSQPVTEYMTCRDVVASGRYPYTGQLGVLSKEDWKIVEDAIRRVHGEAVADRDFMELSDGQKQRILLARALCQQPKVLVLDEPTSFLDIRYKLELLSLIS